MASTSIPCRRFGRTEIDMPVLSLGGMRFQESWKDLNDSEIDQENQKKLEATLMKAFSNGLNHLETARHYGTSERQLGWALQKIPNSRRILQTKIPPSDDPDQFESELEFVFIETGILSLISLLIAG